MTGTQQCAIPEHHVTNDVWSTVNDNIHHAKPGDVTIIPEIISDANKTKGFSMYPCQLFVNRVSINWLCMYNNAFLQKLSEVEREQRDK